MKKAMFYLFPAALFCLLASTALAGVSVGDPAPDFTLNDVNDNPHNLSDYKGKVVILFFWQSTCSHCLNEFPDLDAMAATYKDRGLVVLGLNILQTGQTTQTYQNYYPNILMLKDPYGIVWDVYKTSGSIPLNYIIGHNVQQKVKYRKVGWDETAVENKINNLFSPVSLELIPYNTTLNPGDTLTFDLYRKNWTPDTQTYKIKIDFLLPAGGRQNLWPVRTLSMPGDQVHTKNLNYTMSSSAPLGSYRCRCLIGYPGQLWYMDWFPLEVIP